jgi:hypothetical protein
MFVKCRDEVMVQTALADEDSQDEKDVSSMAQEQAAVYG